ncbi:type II toxin-antitoxin system PemK/MazF family toxin [Halomonas sp. 707B3]|uniref:type II toxin-antitoxin system PemK/MazF family toxin n=1 Tax=Halomonas sp. 707B3 TaxID=1681043 RepID=UPI00370D1E02
MKRAGQIALMPFPFTNLKHSKKRPVLLLRQLDNANDDWLVCMVSSQVRHAVADLDWVLDQESPEFIDSGLKNTSVFRLSRIAVLEGSLLIGLLGSISDSRLDELKRRLGAWIVD